MPRSRTVLQDQYPYHVSARCHNKDWFRIPMEIVWSIYVDQLCYISWVFNAKIHSFVLMNNHFHLLISTPLSNLDKIMCHFMKETSRFINMRSGTINQTYGSRHFPTHITKTHYYSHAYKYVYRNPVQAGLCINCEDYRYSSLHGLLGNSRLEFPVEEDLTLFSDIEGTLKWLNQKPNPESYTIIKNAMFKTKFNIRKDRTTRKPHILESQLF